VKRGSCIYLSSVRTLVISRVFVPMIVDTFWISLFVKARVVSLALLMG